MLAYLMLSVTSLALSLANSRHVEGSIRDASFGFLAKFAFTYDARNQITGQLQRPIGSITAEMSGSDIPSDAKFILYSDEQQSWTSVYHSDISCQAKVAMGKHTTINGKVEEFPGVPIVIRDNFKCSKSPCFFHTEEITQALRPRYWYAVVARGGDCDVKKLTIDHFKVHFVNYAISTSTVESDKVTVEYSADEYPVTPTYCIVLPIWLIGLSLHLRALKNSGNPRLQHSPVMRNFRLSFMIKTASMICHTMHWVKYGYDGIGFWALDLLGQVLGALSTVILWIMLSFLASGFGISSVVLPHKKSNLFGLATIFAFSAAYVAMTVWYYLFRDLASTDYIYDSAPGAVVMILQILYAFWWSINMGRTYYSESHEAKLSFYLLSYFLFSSWFASTPVIAIIAYLIDPWVRVGVVVVCSVLCNTLVYVSAVLHFWPSPEVDVFTPWKPMELSHDRSL